MAKREGAMMAEVIEFEGPGPVVAERPSRKPILMVVRGRNETGKSTLLIGLVSTSQNGSAYPLQLIDADSNNNTLAEWCPSARVLSGTGEAKRLAVEDDFNHIMDKANTPERFDIMADLGGDDTIIPRLGGELGLADALSESGVDPVLVYTVGTDVRHLTPIDAMERGNLFCPPRTVIMPNVGLVRQDLLPGEAYRDVLTSETVQKLKERGARVVHMPGLDPACMLKLKTMVREWHEEADALPDGRQMTRPLPNFEWAASPEGRRTLGMTDHIRVKKFLQAFRDDVRGKLHDWIPA